MQYKKLFNLGLSLLFMLNEPFKNKPFKKVSKPKDSKQVPKPEHGRK
jgi:hypothetical protein